MKTFYEFFAGGGMVHAGLNCARDGTFWTFIDSMMGLKQGKRKVSQFFQML